MIATLRERNFALVWFGGLISLIGDRAMLTALPFFVYQQTGSTIWQAGLFSAYYLPMVLFGSVAGVYVDRWNRQRILVVTNLLQAVVTLLLVLVYLGQWLWLAYVVVFVQSSVAMFFGPAESAIVPNLVDEERLVAANSLGNLNNTIARLIGPPIGGILLASFGLGVVVIVDCLSFLVAALLIARVSLGDTQRTEQMEDAVENDVLSAWTRLWREWREGLQVIRQDRLLVALFIVSTLTSFGGSMIDPLYVPFVRDILHGGPTALGSLSATSALGGILAALVVGHWGNRYQPWRLTAFGTLAVGIIMFVNYQQTTLPMVMMLNFIMFVPLITSSVGMQTMFQNGVADRYRGRVFGAISTTIALVGLVSLWLSGLLSEMLGIVPALSVAATITICAGILALLLLPRSLPERTT